MAAFKDRNGREWPLVIVFGMLPGLRKRGLDLDTLTDESFSLLRYHTGPTDFVDLLWYVVSSAARADEIASREDFDWGLDWEALERAADALVEAILDFRFRRLAAVIRNRQTAENQGTESKKSAGDSPESSASTPGDSVCGNSGG